MNQREQLQAIRTFPQLVRYLRDELDWPISQDDFEDLTFEYTPEELGIDVKVAAKIQEIRRLRPLSVHQPWGIFFVKFEPKRLPVVAMRRMLNAVAIKNRASAANADKITWASDDLLFISNYGEEDNRQITFAHFTQNQKKKDLPTLKVLGWDNKDTALHMDFVAENFNSYLKWPEDEAETDVWRHSWRSAFTLKHREVIDTAKKLSVQLAHLARNIRDRINSVLVYETENGPITRLMNAFKEALVHDLDNDGFADMYAQTIAYGLLSARIANPSDKTSDDFASAMPVTNPFLKELMETFIDVGGRGSKKGNSIRLDFDELGVSEVVDLLDAANMEAVVRDFGDKNPLEDPVTHFYEQFFADYDNSERFKRGVFYTPRPVVSFIVRSVDKLLRTEFGLVDGLADTATWSEVAERIEVLSVPEGVLKDSAFVQILDPATGTGTFLVEAISLIYSTMIKKWKSAGQSENEITLLWNQYVPLHLLPRLHGFELMMAPYAIAHMKIGLKLYETGYRFESNERARIYLTNALEPTQDFSGTLEFAIPALAHEAEAVNTIKGSKRFTVVVGNPPYAGHSANNGNWIQTLVDEYFQINGKSLGEANSKWLRDDYVKFIRLGQEFMRKSHVGLFSFITNHGYVDNPTFRGMRKSLIDDCKYLWIADLHGNTKKKELDDSGRSDENVFDIQQGVAIFTALISPENDSKIWHHHLRGKRGAKYELLSDHNSITLPSSQIYPEEKYYLLVPQDRVVRDEYNRFSPIGSEFIESSLGILTKRDALAVAFTASELVDRLRDFADPIRSDIEVADKYGLPLVDKDKWNLSKARESLTSIDSDKIVPVLYRPFDIRYVYYDDVLVARTNRRVLNHMSKVDTNLALIFGRVSMANGPGLWDACFVSNMISEQAIYRRSGGTVFPINLNQNEGMFIDGLLRLNISKKLSTYSKEIAGKDSSIVEYAYAIFHSLSYRKRYEEFLKIDFPRLPLTQDEALFERLRVFGEELISVHLLKIGQQTSHVSLPSGPESIRVEKVTYSDGSVWLDKGKSTGFVGVPEEVWNFHIGGYQVCEKWLKDRQAKGGKNPRPGRVLTQDDIAHYQKIVVAISETIRIMGEIDDVIEAHGGWPGAFQSN